MLLFRQHGCLLFLLLGVMGCSAGSIDKVDGGSGTEVITTSAKYSPSKDPSGTSKDGGLACEMGSTTCGDGSCCTIGSACAQNTNNQLGCGQDYCCTSCGVGSACGFGC